MEMRGLCEDLVQEILSHVPLKPLVRMKLVSKAWNRIISHIRSSRPRTSKTGLFVQHRIKNSLKVTLLTAEDRGRRSITRNSFSFPFVDEGFFLLSSNGLLLCSHGGFSQGGWPTRFYVYNPVQTKWAALPSIDFGFKRFGLGFAFNGVHFKVVVLLWKEAMTTTEIPIEVFSSETNQWKQQRVRISNSSSPLPSVKRYHLPKLSLFINGAIHWILEEYVLVYNIEEEYFKQIKLPNHDSKYQRCVWESEGHLHYCHLTEKGFHIWKYRGDYDDQSADENSKWHLKTVIVLDTLMLKHRDIFGQVIESFPWKTVAECSAPCVFNEDLQLLFIQLPGIIAAYSFENQKLKQVWSFGEKEPFHYHDPDRNFIQPFVHN